MSEPSAPNPSGIPDDPNTASQTRSPVDPSGVLAPPSYGPTYYPPPPPAAAPKRGGIITRVLTGLVGSLLVMSVVLNIYLGAWFASMMAGPTEATYAEGDHDNRIVVLPIKGMIDSTTANFVHDALKALRENPPKAVVLRVDSGGGGVSASDRIWHEMVQFKEEVKVPIVASFGSIAASGGYYVAAPANYIFAEPTTITGSIGVIAQAMTVQELMKKIGVTPELIIATGSTKKDMLNPMRAWTDEDREALRRILDNAYNRFVDVVAKGRTALTLDQIKQLATGEVFTADQAVQNQLIDEQGFVDAAIEKAKDLAGIGADVAPWVTVISPPRSLSLLGALSTHRPGVESINAGQIRRWANELTAPHIEYRWIP